MVEKGLKDSELETLFRAARADTAAPDAEWLARVAADAGAETRVRARGKARAVPRQAWGFWAQLSAALGGWRGLGGMAAASVTGLWLGIAPPDAFDGALAEVFDLTPVAIDTFGLLPAADPGLADFLEEG